MWVNSASCFDKVHFGALMGKFNMGHCLWPDTLLKNVYNIQEIIWVNSASCFHKVHFGELMGQIQYGPLLLA